MLILTIYEYLLLYHVLCQQKEKEMQLLMIPRCALEFRQELRISGGVTRSIFHYTEMVLNYNTDIMNALKYVAARKKMDRYKSIMDFLFCEIFTGWIFHCRRFYNGEGPPLRDTLSKEQIEKYDLMLMQALEVAYRLFQEDRCKSWKQFVSCAKEKFASAA